MDIGIIIGFLIAGVILSTIYGVWHYRDEKKYDDMQAFYEKRIEQLRKEAEHCRERWYEHACSKTAAVANADTYKKLLSKFIGEGLSTDPLFKFESEVYRPVEFKLHKEDHKVDRLTVEFTKIEV
jgi:hypothetical protein